METLPPWTSVSVGIEAQKLKLRLKKSLPDGHELSGKHAVPVALREDTGQVLFCVPNTPQDEFAVVWLPKGGEPDSSLRVDYYKSIAHWSYKCERPDHRKLVGPSPHYEESVRSLSGMYDGSEAGWVLLDFGPNEEWNEEETQLHPANYLNPTDVLICDDDVYEEVKRKMLEAGARVVSIDELRELEQSKTPG